MVLMCIRSPRDFLAGLLFIAIAVFFIVTATNYDLGTINRMGPGYFPIMVGGLLAVLGASIVLRSMVLSGPPIARIGFRPLLLAAASVALFGVILVHFGLVAAVVALVVVGALADKGSRPLEVILLAIFLAAFSVAVFVHLLGLPLQVWPEL